MDDNEYWAQSEHDERHAKLRRLEELEAEVKLLRAKEHHDGYLVGATAYAKIAGHSRLKSENETLRYVCDNYSWMGRPAVGPPDDAGSVKEFIRQCGIDMKPAVARVKEALADQRDCLEVAGQIAKAVESYEGEDLLGQIVPHLRPLIVKLQWLRKARHDAIRALDEALGDTDLPNEDDSPVFRAMVALTAGADGAGADGE